MKLQIDTELKTIKIEGQVNLKEFTEKIKVILPDWEEYKLETNTVIHNWCNPIIYRTYPYYPWSGPLYSSALEVTTGGSYSGEVQYNSARVDTCNNGVYNVQLN